MTLIIALMRGLTYSCYYSCYYCCCCYYYCCYSYSVDERTHVLLLLLLLIRMMRVVTGEAAWHQHQRPLKPLLLVDRREEAGGKDDFLQP